jgi:hypothetical protein
MSMEIEELTCALCGRRVPRGSPMHVCDMALTGDLGGVFLFGPAQGAECEYCGRLYAIDRTHPCLRVGTPPPER